MKSFANTYQQPGRGGPSSGMGTIANYGGPRYGPSNATTVAGNQTRPLTAASYGGTQVGQNMGTAPSAAYDQGWGYINSMPAAVRPEAWNAPELPYWMVPGGQGSTGSYTSAYQNPMVGQVYQQGQQMLNQLPALNTPGQWQAPTLGSGVSLSELLGANVSFPTMSNYGIDYRNLPALQGLAGIQPYAQANTAYQPVTSSGSGSTQTGAPQFTGTQGIDAPNYPQMPPSSMARPGLPEGGRAFPGMSAGYQANWNQATQPGLGVLEGQWHVGRSGIDNNYQSARAQSGLGWGRLAQELSNMDLQQRANQLGNLTGLVGLMGG